MVIIIVVFAPFLIIGIIFVLKIFKKIYRLYFDNQTLRKEKNLTMNKNCRFCRLSNDNSSSLYSDGDVFVINDIHPASFFHKLVIPKEHIFNISKLHKNNCELIKKMFLIGKTLIKQYKNQKEYKIVFHLPICKSVNHLHMHVIGMPFKNLWFRIIFSKLFTIDVFSLIKKLEKLN